VRNLLDESLYAIKKIKVDVEEHKFRGNNLQKELEKVLQEIRYLAKLKNEHIVTYNHSWIEVLLKSVIIFLTVSKFKQTAMKTLIQNIPLTIK